MSDQDTSPGAIQNRKFSLADLQQYRRDILSRTVDNSEEADAFVLSLALISNDLKGIYFFRHALDEFKSSEESKSEVSAHNGEYSGYIVLFEKLLCGIFFEVLELIQKSQAALHKDKRLKHVIDSLNDNGKKSWETIRNLANGKGANAKAVRDTLQKLRNKSNFHFDDTLTLLAGYRQFFTGDLPHRQYAYVSFGKTYETTRFYFADAAKEAIFDTCLCGELTRPDFLEIANGALKGLMDTSRDFVRGYISLKARDLGYSNPFHENS